MERISLHSLIQRTMCMLGFSLESMADRVSALIWLGDNIGEQWPYYIDGSKIGFNDWKFIRDTDSGEIVFREGANKRGNSSRLTQSFHFFMFEPIFSPVNALNQPI
ncbi:hypothetical protein [Aeromonas allosaccharophila]|uniref:Uncharacterized protein n=1 Tax=Aeromonas allosaccharophila TaxID=656 RepID=A0A7T2UPS9_9GAMM|nr:hypothetical protein [Aeromonas allosaccharophila]QPR56565.1 hypothetical protein I6G90_09310 [Aeromonas allosaccharophila]